LIERMKDPVTRARIRKDMTLRPRNGKTNGCCIPGPVNPDLRRAESGRAPAPGQTLARRRQCAPGSIDALLDILFEE